MIDLRKHEDAKRQVEKDFRYTDDSGYKKARAELVTRTNKAIDISVTALSGVSRDSEYLDCLRRDAEDPSILYINVRTKGVK